MTDIFRQVRWFALVLGSIFVCLTGCNSYRQVPRIYRNPYPQPKIFAVTIFRNLSGSEDIDVMAVTDAFYAELKNADARSFQVVPVNRVLAALADLGLSNVNHPADVATLANALEVDGIIVGAVTQYNPYFPPRLGMNVQLFLRDEYNRSPAAKYLGPKEMARAAVSFRFNVDNPVQPTNTVDRIIDARDDNVVKRLKKYTKSKRISAGPAGWKKYATTENYPYFVSHEIVGELLARERDRLAAQQ